MTEVRSVLIGASAGSGKTYQLSTRYLALLALNGADRSLGASPERLIALTFTRKAAAEFHSRIFSDLALGAATDEGARRLGARIAEALEDDGSRPGIAPGASPHVAPLLTREFFLLRLREMMTNYSRLALGTIDSLFARLAMTASFDLGYSGVTIIDQSEEESGRRRALLKGYRQWADAPQVRRQMEKVFSESLRGEQGAARVEVTLFELVRNLHEIYLDCRDENIWGEPSSLGLSEEEVTPSCQLDELVIRAQELLEKMPLKIPVPRKSSGKPADYARCYRNFLQAVEDMPRKTYLDCQPEDFRRIDDPCPENHPLPDLHEKLQGLLHQVLPFELRRACLRSRAAFRLMKEFDAHYAGNVRSRGRFCFHDVTRALGESGAGRLPVLMGDRIDARYNHWLLDEFQDTSRSQWKVLEPFLSEVVQDDSGKRSLLVVGDEKQSIYQWRGGDVRLFRMLGHEAPWKQALKPMQLTQSFRSAPAVLEMVNDVCQFKKTAEEASPEALEAWICPAHISARPRLTGCARILQTRGTPRDNAPMLEVLCRTMLEIKPWRRTCSGRPLTCAILVSKKKEASRVLESLLAAAAREGIALPAEINDDRNIGVDTPLGKGLLEFFRYLDAPGSTAIRNRLSALPLAPLLHRAWEDWRRIFDTRGYSAVLDEIEAAMAGTPAWEGRTPFLRERWRIWREEAARQDGKGTPLEEWLRHMEGLVRREEASASSVQIMTIHKAKGLGFDVVFIPIFTGSPPFADDRNLRIRREVKGKTMGILYDCPRLLYDHVPALRRLARDWRARQEAEGLCKTYVAITRSVRATYVILPPPTKSKSTSKTSMGKIFSKLAEPGQIEKGETFDVIYSRGEPAWYEELPLDEISGESAEKTLPRFFPAPKPGRVRPSRRNTLPPESTALQEAASLGTAAHAALASWETMPVSPPEELAPDVRKVLTPIWENPAAAALFTPRAGDLVYREQSIEALDPDSGEWISAVVDRLTLHADGSATLVDFKTTRTAEDEDILRRYNAQLYSYAQLVSRACGIPCARIRLIILVTSTGSVIELPPLPPSRRQGGEQQSS